MKKLLFLVCALLPVVLSANAQTTQPAKPAPKPVRPQPVIRTQQTAQQPVQQQPIQTVRINKVDQRINNANNSVNNANNSINHAASTATNAVNTAGNAKNQIKDFTHQVDSLISNKNSIGATSGTANTTTINLKGANYARLKQLNEAILNCSAVQDSKIKFNSAESTITVTHTGSTTDLLKQIQKKSELVTDESIQDLDEGKISLQLK